MTSVDLTKEEVESVEPEVAPEPVETQAGPAPEPAPEPDTGKAAEAAFAEATNDENIVVSFREQKFSIPRSRLSSARFLLAIKTNELHTLLFEALGKNDAGRFIDLCAEGDQLPDVAEEFFEALNKETGLGN